ncbi:MAG: glycosyltransferase family 39 protein [Candidatus Eiseniibacteriota bacterium]
MTRSVVLALLAGLAVRLLALWFLAPSELMGDEREYWHRAVSLAEGREVLGEGKRPPGSIWWYALVVHLFGDSRRVALAANILPGLAVIAIAAALGRRFGGERAMVWSAWAAALYPTFVIYSVSLWSEPLYSALSLGALLLLLPASGRAAPAALFAAGVLLGAAALTREVGIFLPVVAGAWLLSRGERARSAWWRFALVCVGFVVSVAPWTMRQNTDSEAPALVSRTTWKNLYVGNAPLPEGEGGGLDRRGSGSLYRTYNGLGRDMAEREAQAKAIALAAIRDRMPWWPFEKIAEAVPGVLTPNALPVGRLLARPESSGWAGSWAYVTAVDGGAAERSRDVLAWAMVAIWTVTLLGGAAGLALAGAGGRAPVGLFGLFIAFHLLPTILTFGISRFRVPFEPLLLIAAMWWLAEGAAAWRQAGRRRKLAAALAVGSAALILVSEWRTLLAPQFG